MSNIVTILIHHVEKFLKVPPSLEKIEQIAAQLYNWHHLKYLDTGEKVDPSLQLFKPYVDNDGIRLGDNICQDAKSLLYSYMKEDVVISVIEDNGGDVDVIMFHHFREYLKQLMTIDALFHMTNEEYVKANVFIDRELELFPDSHVAYYHLASVLSHGDGNSEDWRDDNVDYELVFENLEKSAHYGFYDDVFFKNDPDFDKMKIIDHDRYDVIAQIMSENVREPMDPNDEKCVQFFISRTDKVRMKQTINAVNEYKNKQIELLNK